MYKTEGFVAVWSVACRLPACWLWLLACHYNALSSTPAGHQTQAKQQDHLQKSFLCQAANVANRQWSKCN